MTSQAELQIDPEIMAEVESLTEEQLRYELMKHKEKQEARRAKWQSEEFKASRKEYFEKNKDKLKSYRLRYQARNKAILARAKELGLDLELGL
jgi:hypothetical protein